MIYLDHNAHGPLSESAKQAWLDAQQLYLGNPASMHRLGQRADVALDKARQQLAHFLGSKPQNIVWNSGATEGANTLMASLAFHKEHKGSGKSRGWIWVSAVEHPCVLEAAERYFPEKVRRIPVTSKGVLDLEQFQEALLEGFPEAMWLMAANNETGLLQPWREVQTLCRERGVPFVCDATQWLGRLSAAELGGCDIVFGSGHKCGGPVGTGFVAVQNGMKFRPFLVGGGQEEGRRAGTQNVAGVLATIAAIGEGEQRQTEVQDRDIFRLQVEQALLDAVGSEAFVVGEGPRLWNTVSVCLPELGDCRQRWVVRLDAAGVQVSTGSACASGKEKGSHVLEAMGIQDEVMGRVLRWSGGWDTTQDEWLRGVEEVKKVWERWRSR